MKKQFLQALAEATPGYDDQGHAVGGPVASEIVTAAAPEEPIYEKRPLSQRYLPADSAARKRVPIASGVVDYFPDALAAVAEVSFIGNEKHNPGQPLHHSRGKSNDHADCIMRHLIERGGFDGKVRHSAALAWRALALLQEELEYEYGLELPRGASTE